MTDRPAPSFAVVVPTYDRPERLRACLEALASLDYPRERYAVVVADDGGSAALGDVVRPFAGRMRVDLARQPNQGPAAARNLGAARAEADYLAFTDDDCAPRPGWLAAFARRFAAEPDALLGGRTANALAGNVYAETSQQLIDYLYAYFGRAGDGPTFFASNNMALAARRFHALGGFDTSFPLAAGEDREFGDRWRHAGGGLVLVEDAVVDHHHALTLRRFWRQHANYGRGAFHLDSALRRTARPRHAMEPWRFYLGLVRYPLGRADGPAPLRGAALMALSQLATAYGYYGEAALGRRRPGVSR